MLFKKRMNKLPSDMLMVISSFLCKKDLVGFNTASKKTYGSLTWSYDECGVHVCIGCDLTASMHQAYNELKKELETTLIGLKSNKLFNRVLASSVFYWDMERALDGGAYVRIQPPAENISKQLDMIRTARIDSGGGAECGGIALCELNKQFKNRWISRFSKFGKSVDVLVLCMDAPFHFITDTSSYYEITRKHAIDTDWVKAFHELSNAGVYIVLFIINSQSCFRQSLDLIGGFNAALGGISLRINTSDIKDMSEFIHHIVVEETERRNAIHNIYKNVYYANKNNPKILDIVNKKIQESDLQISHTSIPGDKIIHPSEMANKLAECKTMQDAIQQGILESEAVFKRLMYNKYKNVEIVQHRNTYPSQIPQPIVHQIPQQTVPHIPSLNIPPLPMLSRQFSIATVGYNKLSASDRTNSMPTFKYKQQKVADTSSRVIPKTFGLSRQTSVSSRQPFKLSLNPITEYKIDTNDLYIIEGSMRCYLSNPKYDFSKSLDKLTNMYNGEELTFRSELLQTMPNQFHLYMNDGIFGRFKRMTQQNNQTQINNQHSSLLVPIPTLSRALSSSVSANIRIAKMIRNITN